MRRRQDAQCGNGVGAELSGEARPRDQPVSGGRRARHAVPHDRGTPQRVSTASSTSCDLVGTVPGNERTHARRHRPRVAVHADGSLRQAPARRRHLLPDAEDDVPRVLQFEAAMIGPDGLPHDRATITHDFAYLLRRRVRLVARPGAVMLTRPRRSRYAPFITSGRTSPPLRSPSRDRRLPESTRRWW